MSDFQITQIDLSRGHIILSVLNTQTIFLNLYRNENTLNDIKLN